MAVFKTISNLVLNGEHVAAGAIVEIKDEVVAADLQQRNLVTIHDGPAPVTEAVEATDNSRPLETDPSSQPVPNGFPVSPVPQPSPEQIQQDLEQVEGDSAKDLPELS